MNGRPSRLERLARPAARRTGEDAPAQAGRVPVPAARVHAAAGADAARSGRVQAAAGGAALLETRGLGLRVGGRTLVQGLDLRLQRGQVWALLGPNGSGKTSLLHALAGLVPPQAGSVALAGKPLAQWPAGEAACLRGLLPQALHDAFPATAMEIVLLGRHPHRPRWGFDDEADRQIAAQALQAVDMQDFAGRDVLGLSGGERQRVGIAALLAQQSLLLLLDEPTAHLDLHHQVMVLGRLRALALEEGRCVLLALHDLHLARRFATHALLLGGGTHRLGPADEVMQAGALTAAFGHEIRRIEAEGRTLFVAG